MSSQTSVPEDDTETSAYVMLVKLQSAKANFTKATQPFVNFMCCQEQLVKPQMHDDWAVRPVNNGAADEYVQRELFVL